MGTPSLSLLLTMHTGEGNAPPAPPATRWGKLAAAATPIAAGIPWALRRPGGRRSAHRRTIPRRRSAAPSGQGERPFVKCGIAAKPARRSPQAAANRQRLPLRVGAPAVAAPRGESGSKADEAAHAAALRPEANRQRAAPAMLAAPAPQPTHDRRAAAGRAFPLGRLLRPGHHAGRSRTRSAAQPLPSLHDPRHRSCTGSRLLAALPALDALRHCSGKAAAAGSGLELRNGPEAPTVPGPNSAYNMASVIRNCQGN